MSWAVVIPVKSPASGKTRLVPGVTDVARVALARAFALDTVAAARAARSAGRVIVVGDDATLADGAEFLAEPDGAGNQGDAGAAGVSAGRGLLAAIRHGIAHARAGSRDATSSLLDQREVAVAVLLGDLPGLTPGELDAALDAATRHPLAFVRDADGTGTTLATAAAGVAFDPQFGPGSAARHAAAGFVELEASAWPGLTRDVDTVDGLEIVLHHGVGDHTADVVAHLAHRKGIA